jgi:hypothetical protein
MRAFISILCALLMAASPLKGASDTFVDYQNFNHGYCPDCNCYPCRCAELGITPATAATPAAAATPPAAPEPVKPDACNQPKPICPENCGIRLWIVGLVLAGTATAGAILVSSNNGRRPRP